MNKWFETKVRYLSEDESGREKPVTEAYLVDAISFTDAEARITETMVTLGITDFEVKSIKTENYKEIHTTEEDGAFFKCNVSFIMFDESRGKEKKSYVYILMQSTSTQSALYAVQKLLSEQISTTYKILSVMETQLIAVIPAEESEES